LRAQIGCGLLLSLVAGCAAPSKQLEATRTAEQPAKNPRDDPPAPYHLGCPDELDISIAGRQPTATRCVVGPDGRINLGNLGTLRGDGKTTVEIAAAVAERIGVSPATVQVVVHDYRSQQVYLVGEINGLQRAVPYQGPERVTELLQRAGGLTSGAERGAVFLVRSHLTEGRAPEVLRVDVPAIVEKHDQHTNYVVEPFDEIVVGETHQSTLGRSLPPWMLPLYQSLFGSKQ